MNTMLTLAVEVSGLNILSYVLWFLVLVWTVSILLTLFGLSRQRPLPTKNEIRLKSDDAPLVSVLVPARNEEHRVLAECIRSILAQDYGRFEVICVDDRSTDATGEILKSLAKFDARLQVIEGEELPAGWLGKPHAMYQALRHARGEWILATDADMIFDKAALRTAVAVMNERGADAISLLPHFVAESFWERVIIPTWEWVMLMFTVSYRVSNPKTPGALAIGGFILMRRPMLERIGGYEALRDEVLEDVRIAERIKRSGGTILAHYAPTLLRTRMYQNFDEMWESCTKSWFAGMKFSMPFAMLCVLWMYLIAVGPPLLALASLIGIATADTSLWRLFLPAALSWLSQVVVLVMMNVRSGISPSYAMTAPLGLGLLYLMLFDSTIRITTGKGVEWKGRMVYQAGGVCPPQNLRARASRVKVEDCADDRE